VKKRRSRRDKSWPMHDRLNARPPSPSPTLPTLTPVPTTSVLEFEISKETFNIRPFHHPPPVRPIARALAFLHVT
jgi:hypothetical protein